MPRRRFPELGQRVRDRSSVCRSRVEARPGVAGIAAGTGTRQTDHLAALRLDFPEADSLADLLNGRAIGVFLVSVIAAGHIARQPVTADCRGSRMLFFPAQYHHDERRARRSDPEGRRRSEARGHTRRPAGQVGPSGFIE